MSGRGRRTAMAALVLATALWPLAHLAAVARWRIDPWEGFGWAMYALPAPRVRIGIDVERAGVLEPLRAMGAERVRVRRFARRRTALGDLASPAPLARDVMERDPSVDAVEILARELLVDPRSARVVSRDHRYRFERPASGTGGDTR